MFPMVSARRLRNIVVECFAPRYIKTQSVEDLKVLAGKVTSSTFRQLLLIYTSRANSILQDFIHEVYWARYTAGRDTIRTDDAKDFVTHAVREGKTQKPWSESTKTRVASYLLGCCSDFGLLSQSRGAARAIQPIRIEETTTAYLAYKLHFEGLGDNAVINHRSWKLFGLNEADVRAELKRLAKNGWLILQSAGDVTRIGWQLKSMENVIDVVA
jgi:hypothetical protein